MNNNNILYLCWCLVTIARYALVGVLIYFAIPIFNTERALSLGLITAAILIGLFGGYSIKTGE